jgi:hypothetical protein
MPLSTIRAEDEVFARHGETGIGAVRQVRPDTLLIHIENYGEVEIGPAQIASAEEGKVLLKLAALPDALRDHLGHAHDAELRDPSQT